MDCPTGVVYNKEAQHGAGKGFRSSVTRPTEGYNIGLAPGVSDDSRPSSITGVQKIKLSHVHVHRDAV